MWSKAESLRFSVKLGLRKGLKLIRGMRRALTDDEQDRVARVIVEDLERGNWKIEQGPEPEGHAKIMGETK
jgi:hypothetical protein